MKLNKRIFTSIIALMIIITSIFSLSSCGVIFGLLDSYLDDSYNENQPPMNQVVPPKENVGQFYPGSGEASTDKIPALQNTLLSTVTVDANFSFGNSMGSGVIYSLNKNTGDAFVITNYHVIYDQSEGISSDISLYLYGMEMNGYEIKATFLGGTINYDIAVLRVSGSEVLKNSYAKAAVITDSDTAHVFDSVYTIGNAIGTGISACHGIISKISEHVELEGADGSSIQIRAMRVDAPVNLGNSGGGLYTSEGELIGIVSAKKVGSNVDNIGYAIPSNLAIALAKNIIDNCNGTTMTKLNRALLGVTVSAYVGGLIVDPETGNISEAEIVEIVEVSSSGAAVGKIQVGDVIKAITVDGVTKSVTRTHHVPEHLMNARVGSKVDIYIERNGVSMVINFTITQDNIHLEK